jgi:ubiquinone/menaquinone biosynthesis C-methylase UbiE
VTDPRTLLAELVPLEGATVVDVGCGDGELVRWLAGRGAHAIGVEVGEEPLARARAADRVADERYEQGGGEALPLPGASADAATFIQSLHHVPVELMDQALAEVARVLRPGGLVFVQEPLARGEQFEVLVPLDDETRVRHAAQAALGRLPDGLEVAHTETFDLLARHTSFEALCDRVLMNDAERTARFPSVEAELRARFERLATPTDGVFVLRQPTKVDLLRKTGA